MKLSDFFKEKTVRDSEFIVLGLLESRPNKKMLTFIDDESYLDTLLKNSDISGVFIKPELESAILEKTSIGIVVTDNPRLEYFNFHNELSKNGNYMRNNFKTMIGDNSKISSHAFIESNNVVIGKNVIVEEFVSIKENTVIGDNCVIRSGSVIGGTGFEFKRTEDSVIPIVHSGGVVIGNCVEIQHNSCIDKAVYPWDNTLVGDYSKIDNLVHIGHAVKIKNKVMVTAMSVIGGRTIIEDNAWIGIGSVIRNGLKIGKSARVNMGSVVTKNVDDFQSVSGNFAIDHKKFIKKMKEGN